MEICSHPHYIKIITIKRRGVLPYIYKKYINEWIKDEYYMYMDLHIIVYGRMKETKNWVNELTVAKSSESSYSGMLK